MPAATDEDPYIAYGFALDITGVQVAQFKSVSGMETSIEVIHTKQTDKKGTVIDIKTAGQVSYGDVTFSRGMTKDMTLQKWFQDVLTKGVADQRKDLSVIAYDQANKEVARWNLGNCWPSKLSTGAMEAGANELIVEEMTFVTTLIERKK